MIPNEEIFDRLESYVDGALDAKARADVDRQLAGNPQLRKLVDELLFARDAVRGLPRAKAPPEMAETFQSSLERGALLGDDGPNADDVVLRINRWPQFISVAAIVLLAVGLAAVIYKVVLPPKRSGGLYAGGPQGSSATEPAGDASATMPKAGEARREVHKELAENGGDDRKDRFGVLRDGVEGVAAKPMAKGGGEPSVPAPVTSPESGNKADGDAVAMKRAADASQPADPGRAVVSADELRAQQRRMGFVGKGGFEGGGGVGGGGGAAGLKDDGALHPAQQQATQLAAAADEPLVLLVQSLDPRQANRDVARYFADNHIEYQAVAEAHNPDGPIPAAQGPAGAPSLLGGERNAGASGGPSQSMGRAGNDARQQQESLQQQATQQPAQTMNRGGSYAGNYANNANNDRAANPPAPAPGPNQTPAAQPGNPDGNNGFAYQQQAAMNRQLAGNSATTTNAPSQAAENQATTAPADASNITAFGALNNGVVLQNGAAPIRANTYRAMLTRRQVQQLKDQLARRDNQWTEDRNEPMGQQQQRAQQVDAVAQRQPNEAGGVVAADKAPAAVANEAGLEMRKSAASGTADKESVALREKAMEGARAKESGPSDEAKRDELASAPRPTPATEPASPTTREAAPAVASAATSSRGMKSAAVDAAKDQAAAPTSQPAGQVASTGGVTRQVEAESGLSVTDAKQGAAKDMSARVESMQKKLAATTEPAGAFAKMGPQLQIDGAVKAEDAPVPVLIVVNDEPVVYNFPANAAPNAAAPATQPAAASPPAAAVPATAPAAPAKPAEQ